MGFNKLTTVVSGKYKSSSVLSPVISMISIVVRSMISGVRDSGCEVSNFCEVSAGVGVVLVFVRPGDAGFCSGVCDPVDAPSESKPESDTGSFVGSGRVAGVLSACVRDSCSDADMLNSAMRMILLVNDII